MELRGKRVLVTGGTGSFGQHFVKRALAEGVESVCVFSRDEYKQHHMHKEITDSRVRWFIGDVRDADRLQRAMWHVDIVVHAAAMKQIGSAADNPHEAVKTNIIGTMNVIDAAIDQGVRKVVFLSSDKAVEPINLYGATKMCGEHLVRQAGQYSGGETTFCAVRYGNVIGSRGSVIELWKQGGPVELTDPNMTRFWITLDDAVDLVLLAIRDGNDGEVFIPKARAASMDVVYQAVRRGGSSITTKWSQAKIVGPRPFEKEHEALIGWEESRNVECAGDVYVLNGTAAGRVRERLHSAKPDIQMDAAEFREVAGL